MEINYVHIFTPTFVFLEIQCAPLNGITVNGISRLLGSESIGPIYYVPMYKNNRVMGSFGLWNQIWSGPK